MSDPFEQARAKVKPVLEAKDFRVFVFGPGLKPGDVPLKPNCSADKHDEIVSHALYLRAETSTALKKLGFTVDYGETAEVLDFWAGVTLAADPGSIEIHHAEKMCGAIVIYPSSIGSICELGLFATRTWICEKTLAVVHQQYAYDRSFFRQGLLEVFGQERGTHEFHDYADHQACIAAACKFVRGRYQALLRTLVMYEQVGNKLRGTFAAQAVQT